MKINLDNLTIKPPTTPTREWNRNNRAWEDYRVPGFIDKIKVGNITISRALNRAGRDNDDFFLDITKDPPMPKPFVAWQITEENFRGNGICGRIIILTNEFYRGKLGTTLYSDTNFIKSYNKQSKRVWQKLQEQGLAKYIPYIPESGKKQDRWVMLY